MFSRIGTPAIAGQAFARTEADAAPSGMLTVGPAQSQPGGAVLVPLTLSLNTGVSVDSLSFGFKVIPVGTAPALTTGTLLFTKDPAMPTPSLVDTGAGPNVISIGWLHLSPALSGTFVVGQVTVNIPSSASLGQTYLAHITGVSATLGNALVSLAAGPDGTLNGFGPKVSLSNVALNFGVLATSTTSAAKTVTLTNSGDSTLTVISVSAGGNFAQTNNCASLDVSGNCTINVTFTPTVAGARLGVITIVDSAAGSPHMIRLFGTGGGTAPAIGFSGVSVNFGNQANGVASGAKTVTVTNTGNATLTITAVTPSGDFSASGCVTSLAPAATCTLSITFTPSTTGVRRGSVTLTDNASGSPQVIHLFGNGT